MASSISSRTNVSLEIFLCERRFALNSSVLSWLKEQYVRMGNFEVVRDENEDIGISIFNKNQRLNVAKKKQLQRAYRAIKYGEMQVVDSLCSRTSSIHSRSGSMVQMDEATDELFFISIIVSILMLDQPPVSGEMRSHFVMFLTEMTDNLEVTSLVAKVSTDAISAAALQQVFELLNYIHIRRHERLESSSANNSIAVKNIDWIKK